MLAAFQLQKSLLSGGEQAPRPRYVYELLCGARKERLGYLKHTLALLHSDQISFDNEAEHAPIVERAKWITVTLSELPYEKDEDPLTVVYHINRQLSLQGDSLIQSLGGLFGDSVDEPRPASALEQRAIELAGGSSAGEATRLGLSASLLCLLVLLKQHLKRLYHLSDLKCQAFDINDVSSSGGRPVSRLAESMRIDLTCLWTTLPPPVQAELDSARAAASERAQPKSAKKGKKSPKAADAPAEAQPLEGSMLLLAQYTWLRELVTEDEGEIDFNLLTAGQQAAPKAGKGRSTTKGRATPKSGGSRGSGPSPHASKQRSRLPAGARASRGSSKRKRKSDSSEDDDADDADDDDDEFGE